MLYIEDLKRQIVKRMREAGFNFGAFDTKSDIKFPFCMLSIENDTQGDCKQRCYNRITLNVELIAKGDDEFTSLINDYQQSAMKTLVGSYLGDEHSIQFVNFDIIQYIDEEDENFNLYRRIIPCNFLIQTNNF